MALRILIVEDDPGMVELLTYNLKQEGFNTEAVNNGADAIKQATVHPPDLILLDLLLPKVDGLKVCRLLRLAPKAEKIPIIILTAKGEEVDWIIGLELGADDYITKPFSPREIVLRVHAVLRRISENSDSPAKKRVEFDDVTIDLETHQVFRQAEEIELTATEFKLLTLLAGAPGRIFTRDVLMDAVWGQEYYGVDRAMDKHVSRLRHKLGPRWRAD
jgi:DNA-binding response OmpR family regulator